MMLIFLNLFVYLAICVYLFVFICIDLFIYYLAPAMNISLDAGMALKKIKSLTDDMTDFANVIM